MNLIGYYMMKIQGKIDSIINFFVNILLLDECNKDRKLKNDLRERDRIQLDLD